MTPVTSDSGFGASGSSEALPADAPLTAEEVEDEAIRGDFMIRWAVVLIGLLLGCCLINDTTALVRIRTGEFMQSHGFLPPRTDSLSVASDGKPWANLSWLLDHLLAVAHRLGGGSALTVLTAAGVGTLFWLLSRVTLPKIPTWWGSVCAALALIAAFNVYTPSPMLVTLLGTAATALLLHRWSLQSPAGTPWGLVALFWVWAQCDPNVFVGMVVLVMYVLGEAFLQDERPDRPLKGLWIAAAASLAVCLLHPFHWHVFEAPYQVFRVEQPQMREYFSGVLANAYALADYSPVISSEFRQGATLFDWFGVALIGVALLAQLVNWKRLHWAWLLAYVGVNGLACASARYLPVASVINAVVATINGQIWYQNACRQQYTTSAGEVFFSRAGRAVTVIGLFLLAYLSVNGWLINQTGRRVGIGFHPDLLLNVKSTRELSENQFDDRPFHLYLSQGDYLIWVGKKSFVDSRLGLHAGSGAAKKHRDARQSLLDGKPSPDAWKGIFDEHQVTHVFVRTVSERDVGDSFRKFLQRGWVTTRLSSCGMAVYRPDIAAPEFAAFVQKEPLMRVSTAAFRDKPPEASLPSAARPWPRPIGAYDRWLIQPLDSLSEGALLASQYGTLLDAVPNAANRAVIRLRTTLALQTIREARIGLAQSPKKAGAYRRMGAAALQLHALDSQWLQALSPGARDEFWLRYALAAYQSAQILDPEDFRDHEVLFDLCFSAGARDWALYHLDRLLENLPAEKVFEQYRQQRAGMAKQLRENVEQVQKSVRSQLGIGGPRPKAIQQAVQDGCWRLALELFEEDVTAFGNDSAAQQLYSQLLLYAGRLEESWQVVESQESQLPPTGTPGGEVFASQWRNSAAMANLMNGNEDRSIQLWDEDRRGLQRMAAESALSLAPLTIGPPAKVDLRGLLVSTQAYNDAQQSEREALDGVHGALAELVCWRNQAATRHLRDVLERNPETAQRMRVVYWLSLLSDDRFDAEPPSMQIPVWGTDMFAETDPPETKTVAEPKPAESTPAEPKPPEKPATASEKLPAKPAAAEETKAPDKPADPPKAAAPEKPAETPDPAEKAADKPAGTSEKSE